MWHPNTALFLVTKRDYCNGQVRYSLEEQYGREGPSSNLLLAKDNTWQWRYQANCKIYAIDSRLGAISGY